MGEPKMAPYLVEYEMAGGTFCAVIDATSWADAERRIRCMGATGQVIGSDVLTVPVWVGLRIGFVLAKLRAWWRRCRR